MEQKKVLILDYSVDRKETANIKSCFSKKVSVSSLYIDTAASFPDDLITENFSHVIHTGSALSIIKTSPFESKAISYIRELRNMGVWQMGICYGHQLICKALVGEHAVRFSPNGFEVGWGDVNFTEPAIVALGIHEKERVWQHHFDEVIGLPVESEIWASNSHCQIQGYINYEQRLLGTQFHPEFDEESGNNYFLEDRDFLENNNVKVNELIKGKPSFDSKKLFFDFFLKQVSIPIVKEGSH